MISNILVCSLSVVQMMRKLNLNLVELIQTILNCQIQRLLNSQALSSKDDDMCLARMEYVQWKQIPHILEIKSIILVVVGEVLKIMHYHHVVLLIWMLFCGYWVNSSYKPKIFSKCFQNFQVNCGPQSLECHSINHSAEYISHHELCYLPYN